MPSWTTRRRLLAAGLAAAAARTVPAAAQPAPLAAATAAAQAAASRPYAPPPPLRRPALLALGYDQYRDIRPRPGTLLWDGTDGPFRAAFFPTGSSHRTAVDIVRVADGRMAPVVADAAAFTWPPGIVPGPEPVDLSGFRIHYPLNRPDMRDEVAVFLDASYFRLLGRGHVYGASARGLAIDTGLARPEEFPDFRRFWLEQPDPEATSLAFCALLDSPGMAGAYRFVLRPGTAAAPATTLAVEARLFARHGIGRLGLAPLTSMFLTGESTGPAAGDYRPEVHDSDGLLIATAGERLWRPLANPRTPRTTRFAAARLAGFGLLQRDRSFASYQDAEALYHRRPSLWVEPQDGFAAGAVHLVELPTDSEFADNVVAFWVPEQPVRAGDALSLRYTLAALSGDPPERPGEAARARAVATRFAHPRLPGAAGTSAGQRVFIDFAGGALATLGGDEPVDAALAAEGGETGDVRIEPLPDAAAAGTRRLTFTVRADGAQTVVLRAALTRGGQALSETWTMAVAP
jgi:glucans biosynthesis protein